MVTKSIEQVVLVINREAPEFRMSQKESFLNEKVSIGKYNWIHIRDSNAESSTARRLMRKLAVSRDVSIVSVLE